MKRDQDTLKFRRRCLWCDYDGLLLFSLKKESLHNLIDQASVEKSKKKRF